VSAEDHPPGPAAQRPAAEAGARERAKAPAAARELRHGGAPGPGRRSSPGFTLLELIIVTVMMGILAAIAFPIYRGFREDAATATLQEELRLISTAEEMYFVEFDRYTDDPSRLDYRLRDDVQLELQTAGGASGGGDPGTGWAGRITDPDFGVRCAVFHGAAAPYAPATVEGQVACDGGG